MKAYLDGKQVAAKAGMKIIARSSQKIEHVMMDSFFGGGSEAFAAKRNEVRMRFVLCPSAARQFATLQTNPAGLRYAMCALALAPR